MIPEQNCNDFSTLTSSFSGVGKGDFQKEYKSLEKPLDAAYHTAHVVTRLELNQQYYKNLD